MTDSTAVAAHHEIPEGMSPDARESWPSRELIDSWLGDSWDFELRPGEHVAVDSEEAAEQARAFRDVLGRYASAVTVVTTMSDGVPVGMTCQSFVSVSLDPPLVAFLPTRKSRAFAAIQRAAAKGVFLITAAGNAGRANSVTSSGSVTRARHAKRPARQRMCGAASGRPMDSARRGRSMLGRSAAGRVQRAPIGRGRWRRKDSPYSVRRRSDAAACVVPATR
jgi:hypothetical protein